jgi:biotin carboxylase
VPARVLVLQTGTRPGPWTCRSLARAGHVVVSAHDGGSGGLSGPARGCATRLRSPSADNDAEEYRRWLGRTAERHGIDVIVPLTEGVTHLLATTGDLGGARRAGPDAAVYAALCDKDGLARTAARAGVPAPRGVVVVGAADGSAGPLPEPPCIVKPLASSTPAGGRVVYEPAVAVVTRAQRDAEVARMTESVGAVVVQELVRGRRWRLHLARGRTSVAAIAWETVLSQPRDTGMSSVSRLRPVPPELARAALRLMDAAGHRGIGSFQAFETADGYVVHDVNLRPVYTVGASVRAGLDLPAMAVEIAQGREPRREVRRVRPLRYVSLSGELRAAAQAARGARLGAAARALGEVAAAAALPGRMLDPCDLATALDLARARHARGAAERVGAPSTAGLDVWGVGEP